ncbi:putative RNA-binding protein RbpE [Smittium mucronatum]|uniref:Putative RNA-binding protein RbpE n=1 Tax=Smittium mucronatum TaxID=133383 RepID=A0A1R0GNS0_9FUNG|nr:putative RNA-binding protein RbpE [Smittium mucronatum]
MSTYADSAHFNKNDSSPSANRKETNQENILSNGISIKSTRSHFNDNSSISNSGSNSKNFNSSSLISENNSKFLSSQGPLDTELSELALHSYQEFDYSNLFKSFEKRLVFFWGLSKEDLDVLVSLSKELKAIKLNVDPGDGISYSGDISFKSKELALRAFAIYNGAGFQKGRANFSSLKDYEIPPPQTNTLKITQLPLEANIISLYEPLGNIGPIYKFSLGSKKPKDSYAVGYVQYFHEDHLYLAIDNLSFTEFMGNLILLKKLPRKTKDVASDPASLRGNNHSPSNFGRPLNTEIDQSYKTSNNGTLKAEENTNSEIFNQTIETPKSRGSISMNNSANDSERSVDKKSQTPPGFEKSSGGLGGIIVPGKLFVTNLSSTVSHSELFDLFKKYGYVNSARVSIDASTGKSRGHGIVQMGSSDYSDAAMKALNGMELKGHRISIHNYEHIPKTHKIDGAPQLSSEINNQSFRRMSDNHDTLKTPTRRNSRLSHGGVLQPSPANEKIGANTKLLNSDLEVTSTPFSVPKISPHSHAKKNTLDTKSNYRKDPIFDLETLNSLSLSSRSELLAQKLVSEADLISKISKPLSAAIITFLVSQQTEFVIDLLDDPEYLADQWGLVSRNNPNGKLDPTVLNIVTEILSKKYGGDVQKQNYTDTSKAFVKDELPTQTPENPKSTDPETESYITQLNGLTEVELKKKLGARLFPLIKVNHVFLKFL